MIKKRAHPSWWFLTDFDQKSGKKGDQKTRRCMGLFLRNVPKIPFFWQKIIGVPLWFLSKKGSFWVTINYNFITKSLLNRKSKKSQKMIKKRAHPSWWFLTDFDQKSGKKGDQKTRRCMGLFLRNVPKIPFFWQKIIGLPLWFLSKKGSFWVTWTPFLVICLTYISKRAQKRTQIWAHFDLFRLLFCHFWGNISGKMEKRGPTLGLFQALWDLY